MRGHQPIVINQFNGLWKRGDAESTPLDHFSDCNNIQYIQTGFKSRDGVDTYVAISNVKRIYTYNQPSQQGLLILDDQGNIYHSLSPTPLTPILTIASMTDFAFIAISGRAYISPHDGVTGLNGEYLYVYMGDGTAARKAAGKGPIADTFAATNSASAGNVEAGIHIFAVVYETNTGFLTKIGVTRPTVTADGTKKVDLSNISVSPDTFVAARHIVATKAIDPTLYTGDTSGYQFFFVPDGTIQDNTTTSLTVNFYDADLLEDASYLEDIYESIPAGVNLCLYHSRLAVIAQYGAETGNINTSTISNIATALVSSVGEPEAINTVTGLIVAPLDSAALTNGNEYRDILYLFKLTKTYAYTDNGSEPASWPLTIIDQAVGCPCHGLATVLDSGGVNVDYLIIGDYSGIMLFIGTYARPELSWKIQDFWLALARDTFNEIQILNDSIAQVIYIKLPDGTMLTGNYSNAGLDNKSIRWAPWSFVFKVTGLAFVNVNELIIAADGPL